MTNPATLADASFMTLEGVMTFFTSPHVALAGWVHYLAFDLFIGAREVRDVLRRGIKPAVRINNVGNDVPARGEI